MHCVLPFGVGMVYKDISILFNGTLNDVTAASSEI